MRESSTIQINNDLIGDNAPCFITFEAGPTHQGLQSAKRLAKYAKEAGGNAIKFQVFDPLRLVADPALPFTYQVLADAVTGQMETVTEPLRGRASSRCRRASAASPANRPNAFGFPSAGNWWKAPLRTSNCRGA